MEKEYLQKGLTDAEVREKIKNGQVNGDSAPPTKSVKEIIYTNICTFFNLLNIILGLLVILVGSYKNALFLGVIFFNIIIGIFQEIRAKRVIDRLSLISAPKAAVLRNGAEKEISTAEIVLDDLMLLSAGKQICSDCVVLEGECEVNESLITGESDPVIKKAGDQMMSGSFIVSGNVKARVNRVGEDNFAAKITAGAKYLKKNNSVMLRSLDTIIKVIAACIIPMAIGLFLNSIFISEQTTDRAVVSTVAALIGMIPEGLYLLASVVMAVSTIRLAQKNTLAQDMYCIETLARVDTLCLDKTGTITEGRMEVTGTELLQPDFPIDKAMTAFVSVMNDDNPTFNAAKEHWQKKDGIAPKEIRPFSSARKWSGAEFEEGSLIFGAPEFVLGKDYEKIADRCRAKQEEGLRVLIAAYSENGFNGMELPSDITPAALIFIGDVIRKEAPDTLKFFDRQGVEIKIISGDNPLTVSKIAARAGVKNAEKYADAAALKDADIPEAAKKYTVFGRVSPQQKLLLVKALKAQGRTVGMTGDGVNDVLALKEADCSIAMQSGSDAARSVSNLVLLDSNFASMPKVVAEGRRSVNNLQRSGALFLTKTVYSFMLAFIFMFLPLPYPFQPIQLTLISTTAIGTPSFLLALEPNTEIIKGSFIRNMMKMAIPQGITVALCTLASVLVATFTDIPIDCMSTLTTVTVAAVSYFVVYRVMKPLRPWKIAMLAVMTAGFAGAGLLFPSFFSLQPLSFYSWLAAAAIIVCGIAVMTVLAEAADPIIEFFYGIFYKLRKWVRKIFKKKKA
ncbi:MAG: cation-translocating P-type ATPase [Firmicutes bacterium]|nr:cation-translocating P-type ATPase [[Eubacterium] siraeum]MCM1486983.1 cation-translocating P-type ATPase [Bacillota bacterium]